MTTEAEKSFTPLNKALSDLFRLAMDKFDVTFDAAENHLTDDHLAFKVKDARTGEARGEIAFNPYDENFETSVSPAGETERTATVHMHLRKPENVGEMPMLSFQETAALISLSVPAFQHILAPK